MLMPHWPMPPWHKNIKYDLNNIIRLLEKLGSPHLKLPPVIHIAGTNGKGSSVALFKSIFEAAGLKAHSYTSPHLIEYNERIVLANEKISDNFLFEICEKTRLVSLSIGLEPTFFEGTTVAAFLAFSQTPADILILETGLGGRLDATNVVPKPLLTLITPISYDHIDVLGNTLSLIATEKAGIIKPEVPCLISCQTDEVYEILLTKCQEVGAPAFCYEYDFGLMPKNKESFIYLSKTMNLEFPKPSLLGDHQLINAATVIAGIGLINKEFNITTSEISTGLKNTIWPARIQQIDPVKYQHLASNNIRIWVDGAHNNGGAQVLAHWLKDNLESPIYLILGMTKNRNIEDFCAFFRGLIAGGYGVRVISETSSYGAEILSTRANSAGINFCPAESLEEAIREINTLSRGNANIIVTGSLFLAADFFKLISQKSV